MATLHLRFTIFLREHLVQVGTQVSYAVTLGNGYSVSVNVGCLDFRELLT